MKLLSHSLFIPTEQSLAEINLPASLKRRAPRIWKIAYAAACRAIAESKTVPEAIIVGTALGALDETMSFIEKVHRTNMGSPRQFIASVHNSMGGILAIEFGITGTNLTLCESSNSTSAAIHAAKFIPESTILVVIVDENLQILDQIYDSCPNRELFTQGEKEGALALILNKAEIDGTQITSTAPHPVESSTITAGTFFSPAVELSKLLTSRKSGTIESFSPTSQCSSTIMVTNE